MKVRASLTGRFFAYYGFIQMLGLIGMVVPMILPLWAVLTLTMLWLTLRDRRFLTVPGDFAITLKLPPEPRLSLKTDTSITVEIRSERALRQSEIRVLAPRVSLFRFSDKEKDFDPRGLKTPSIELVFPINVVKLGYVKVTAAKLQAVSPLGFFRTTHTIPVTPTEFRVGPERVRLPEQAFQQLIQTQKILYQGSRLRAQSQAADQFHSIRNYQYPDPLRHIDQKKTARYQKPMTRVFDTHLSHHLILVFDSGRAMLGEINGSLKSDYYISAALALAENAIRSRDRVSLVSFSQKTHSQIKSAKTLAPFLALFRGRSAISPREEESNYRSLPSIIRSLSATRSIVVILTDSSKPSVQEALLESLGPICHKHLTVVLSLVDRDNDLDTQVLALRPDGAAKDSGDNSALKFTENYSDLLYSYWSREKQIVFRDKVARIGGATLSVNDTEWMACVERLYELLRNSQLS